MNKKIIEEILYEEEKDSRLIINEEGTNFSERHLSIDTINKIASIDDEETLFVIANNYDYDNGLEIPNEILKNKYCSYSVAMVIFENVDGFKYLIDKNYYFDDVYYSRFIDELYNNLINDFYYKGEVKYVPNLSKEKLRYLEKELHDKEASLIGTYEGIDLYDELY